MERTAVHYKKTSKKKKAKLYKGNLTQEGRKVVCVLSPCVKSTKETFTLFNKVFENLKVCSFESSWYPRIFCLAGKSLESSLGSYLGCKRRAVRTTGAFSPCQPQGRFGSTSSLSSSFLSPSRSREGISSGCVGHGTELCIFKPVSL